MIPREQISALNKLIECSRKLDRAMRLHVTKLNELVKEDFDNINRMSPVKLGRPSGSNKKSSSKDSISNRVDYVSIPTPAEMEYYQSGLRLPDNPKNLQKLIDDMNNTGRFDYELCYLLRKQEAMEDLKNWVVTVQKKRLDGEQDYGKEANSDRFSNIFETQYRSSLNPKSFKNLFLESLRNDCES